MLSAPIALDWVGYNSYNNQGELMSEKEWDETVRKAQDKTREMTTFNE